MSYDGRPGGYGDDPRANYPYQRDRILDRYAGEHCDGIPTGMDYELRLLWETFGARAGQEVRGHNRPSKDRRTIFEFPGLEDEQRAAIRSILEGYRRIALFNTEFGEHPPVPTSEELSEWEAALIALMPLSENEMSHRLPMSDLTPGIFFSEVYQYMKGLIQHLKK